MACGANTRVRFHSPKRLDVSNISAKHLVDYILFMSGDVDVTPNLNEIRDYKYVSKAELIAMFEDSGT